MLSTNAEHRAYELGTCFGVAVAGPHGSFTICAFVHARLSSSNAASCGEHRAPVPSNQCADSWNKAQSVSGALKQRTFVSVAEVWRRCT
jgi:hypothetical protein